MTTMEDGDRAFRAFSCHYVNVISDNVTVAMMGIQTKGNILIKQSFFLFISKTKKKHNKNKTKQKKGDD